MRFYKEGLSGQGCCLGILLAQNGISNSLLHLVMTVRNELLFKYFYWF
jgi:hypothetical protein